MCRADIAPAAEHAVAMLLADIAGVLAQRHGADPADVRIGPVDLGRPDDGAGHPEG